MGVLITSLEEIVEFRSPMYKMNLQKCVIVTLLLFAFGFGFAGHANAASPEMVRVHTWEGDKHFGPLIDENEDEVSMFDIAAATTVTVQKSAIKTKVDKIDEVRSDSYVPFASYAAWKLSKILHTGRLEATIVHNSEKGIFVNCGSEDGIEANRRCVLLGDPETIVDPTTDEILGVIREQLGDAIPLTVVSERLSKLNFPEPADEDAQKVIEAFAVKRQVEIEQQAKRIVLAPPRWKPTADAESLEDDANFLHAHLIAELVRYGFTVVSKKQTELMRQSIADARQIKVSEVPDIEIAKGANADVLVSVDMLAKGVTCQVQLQVTDLKSDEYLGIVSGSTRRKEQKEDSRRAVAFAQGLVAGKKLGVRLNHTVVSFFAQADYLEFDDEGLVVAIRWGNQPMTKEQFSVLCQIKSLRSFECGGSGFADWHVERMAGLNEMRHAGIWGTQITDKSLLIIRRNWPLIRNLNIGETKALTNNGATSLSEMKELEVLDCSRTNLSDEGLDQIAKLPKLRHIDVLGCSITDDGLSRLQASESLKSINVRTTKVTRQGVQALQAALPKCTILSAFSP